MIVFSVVHRRLRLGPAPKLYSIAECLQLLRFTVPRARGFCQAMRCICGNACASIHIRSFYGFVCLICLPSFSNVNGIHIGPLPVSGLVHFWLFWPQSERQTDGRTDEHPSPSVKPRGLWKWCFESSISMFLLLFADAEQDDASVLKMKQKHLLWPWWWCWWWCWLLHKVYAVV